MHDETSLPYTQINQICDRFEDAWKQGEPINIADFLAMASPADRQRLLEQLLPIDIEFRQKTDATCDPATYTALGPEAIDLAVSILGKSAAMADQATMIPGSSDASSTGSNDSDLEFDVAFEPTRSVKRSIDTADSQRIGRYKLLQQIGEGGMGTVWMAEQQEPVRRRVALKVIKTGMDSKQVIARFEAERQALALMDHQNIARVLDAGTTAQGLPYFVMELVKGIPCVDYCNQNRLDIKERLELFVPVCKAIQHAHQKGIIHRDLKPSNVLVTLYDGHPVPKVIDFGLAKALDQQAKLTDRTMFTEFGQVVGTLQYMSPEQAEMNALDVDTRTDVYSLGVMLYELLTGTTPIETETLKQNALMKVLQVIRETDPPRPSIRLSQSGEAVSSYSEQRKIESGRLQQMLRGELDWIVMKSLEKDRTRRYETANAFVEDIQRYLADEAIQARPASARYLFGKFVKKHRGLVASIVALTGLLIAGIIGTSYGLVKATQKTAEAVEQKQRANEQAEKALVAEKVAKQKETEAATAAEKSREAEALAKQNEQHAVAAQKQVEQTLARSNIFLAVARWRAGRVQDSREFLAKIPPVHRNVEWGLLRRQLEGCEMTCYGHIQEVRRVRFTADRTRIVSQGGKIKIWDAATGNELKEITGRQFDLNPAGTQLAVSNSDGKIKLFDLSTGDELRTFLDQQPKHIFNIRFSNNGKLVATIGLDRTIKLWDAESGELLNTITTDEHDFVKNICFSPDGKWIATVGRSVALWDTRDGKQLRTFKVHSAYGAECVCVSPDGRWIATGSNDHSIKLWDANTGQEVRSYAGHTDRVLCVSFNPNGLQIVSGSEDGTIKLWNTDDSQEILTHRGHTAKVSSIAFSPDGTRIVSGSKDSTIKLWNATVPKNLRLIRGHDANVNCLCFSPDGKRIASGSTHSPPKIWDALTGESIVEMNEPHCRSASIAFKRDGTQVVSGETDGTIRLWDASTGNERLTLLGHESRVTSVSFSSDDTLIVSAGSHVLKLWDAVTGKEIRAWKDNKNLVKDACFSPDGKSIITTYSHGAIKRWDIASGAELTPIKDVDLSAVGPCIAVSVDGTLIASGSRNTMINIWDAATGQEVNTLQGHVNPIRSLSFSPDGKRLVSITGGITPSTAHTVKLWDVATGEELISLKGQSHNGSNIVFSPDGSTVAWASASANAATDYSIKLWDVTTAEEITVLKGIGYHKVVKNDDSVKIVISEGTKKTVVWDSSSVGPEWAGSLPQIISSRSNSNLLLVNRSYRDAPKEKSFRQFKARLDPSYHAVQATIAEKNQDWYAATFHRAWEFKGDPNRRFAHHLFKQAYQKLKTQYNEQEQTLTDFLSPLVVEVAGVPLSSQRPLTISDSDAEDINRDIWQKIKSPKSSTVKNGYAVLSQAEINSLRNVSMQRYDERQYLKMLLVAEYRLNHLRLVMETEFGILNLAQAQKVEPEWSPAELAVIAMSHHKLGNKEKAAEYRARLDEAMKLAKYSDDEDNQSFLKEVNDLLGPPTLDETDNK